MAAGSSVEGGSEELDDETRRIEGLQLALRMVGGVPVAALPDDKGDLAELVERRGDRAHLTVEGRLLANEVALRLV